MGASLDGVLGALSGPGLPDCKSKSDGFLLKDFRRIVDSSVCKSEMMSDENHDMSTIDKVFVIKFTSI